MKMLIFDPKLPENFVIVKSQRVHICLNKKIAMNMSAQRAFRYVNTYGASRNSGFYSMGDFVRLTHRGGMISFTKDQAKRLIELIRAECKV